MRQVLCSVAWRLLGGVSRAHPKLIVRHSWVEFKNVWKLICQEACPYFEVFSKGHLWSTHWPVVSLRSVVTVNKSKHTYALLFYASAMLNFVIAMFRNTAPTAMRHSSQMTTPLPFSDQWSKTYALFFFEIYDFFQAGAPKFECF